MGTYSPAPPGITTRDWRRTSFAVRMVVLSLQAQVVALTERVSALEERTQQTSQNSSRPPSSDLPSVPVQRKGKRSVRKQGGQPGHVGHGRPLVPLEQVDAVVDAAPSACGSCGHLLLGVDPQPARHQVTEVPVVRPTVTEYRRHTLTCPDCGERTTAAWPVGMPAGNFGPRVAATVAYLTGRCGVSQRETQEVLATVCHLELGLGSIAALERQVSAALAGPVAEAQAAVQAQRVANVDETSWREQTRRCWLWVAVTAIATVFLVRASRSSQSAQELLGADYAGTVGSDRYCGYNWLATEHRQVCWSHLTRDFTAVSERSGKSKALGQACLDIADRLFTRWWQLREGTIDRATFVLWVSPLQGELHVLLEQGLTSRQAKTQSLCANLLKIEPALWTFVHVGGVEPTNNAAERAVRRAVLWRRRSFGTQSAAGSRFVERVLTAVATLRQQRRDVLDYLTQATQAALAGQPGPSLLLPTTAAATPQAAPLPLAA